MPRPTPAGFALLSTLARLSLAHHDGHWTPVAGHANPLRDPTDLAEVPADTPAVLAAVHDATDAVIRVGAHDRRAIRAAACPSPRGRQLQGWLMP